MNDDLLTVTDSAGRSLVLERQDDGVVGVWIADVGENDGVSVLLGESARAQMAEFMRAGDA